MQYLNVTSKEEIIKKFTIDEIIAHCDKVCGAYETISEETGRSIHCIDDYMRYYQIEEWLNELKEYKATDLTPFKIKQMDQLYLEKCKEVDELKKKLEMAAVYMT